MIEKRSFLGVSFSGASSGFMTSFGYLVCLCLSAYVAASVSKLMAQGQSNERSSGEAVVSNVSEEAEIDYRKISEAEWKKRLTKTQFNVTRKHGTEPPFKNKYHDSKKDGLYTCVCCGQPLFDSKTKFDSGTGWPSFYQPIEEKQIGTSEDKKLGYPRVEVHCSRCDAHLGHVFQDAPLTPTGLRYCMNSAAMNFLDREAAEKVIANMQNEQEKPEVPVINP